MKCNGCMFADWKRTATGRPHPDGTGRCTYLREHPLDLRLPAGFGWGYSGREAPKPTGGYIERREELHRDCEFKKEGLSL